MLCRRGSPHPNTLPILGREQHEERRKQMEDEDVEEIVYEGRELKYQGSHDSLVSGTSADFLDCEKGASGGW